MDLTIYTYGYYEAIYQVLNAVAMIRNSAFYMALIETAVLLTMGYYIVKGAYLAGSGGYKPYIMKAIGMILVVELLLLPKVPMYIKDTIEHKLGKVDNIPIAFAVPVGIIENFGHILALVFEQAFAPVEALGQGGITQSSYYKYGSVFGARLKKELSQSRIRDPEFLENMRNFHKRCIILPAMIGYQFTPQELFASKNMWKLVKDNAGTLTRIDMRVGKARTTMNCKEAADVFENYFNDEMGNIVSRNINKVYARATNSNVDTSRASAEQLNQVFFANIKANYSEIRPAQETLKQHMMINFIQDYSANSSYGRTRAKMQQESSALISSDLAQESLPMLLVIFKCLVTVAFIFVVPAMLMSGGMKAFFTYLKVFVSLQLWPAINSVINMIMVLYSNLTPGSDLLVTYSTASTIENNMDSIVTIAANLQYAIPILSYYIVSSSSNAMANLAGSLSGSINSAASMAAGEVTTGNRSFDNISEGNLSKNMKNANKTDLNQSYVSGEIRQQLSDGTAKTTHADGTSTYIAPEPQANYNLSTATQSHVSQGLTNSVSEHEQDQRTLSTAKSNTMAKSTAFLANLIERQHAGENLGIDTSTKEGKDLSNMVEAGAREYEKNGHDKNQAASTTLSGGISGDLGWGGGSGGKGGGSGDDGLLGMAKKAAMNYVMGGLVSALVPDTASLKVNAALDFKGSADSTSNQGIGEEGHHSEAVNVKRNLEVLSNASKGETWGKENSSDQTKATEVRAAYEEQTRAEESVTNSAQKVQEYQNLVQHSSSVTGTSDRNMRHQLIKQLTSQGWGQDTAAQMVGNGHPEAQRAFDKVVARQVAQVANQINQGKGELSDENLQQNLNKTGEENKNKITTNPNNLINPQDNPTTANFDKIPGTISAQEQKLGDQVAEQQNKATDKINTAGEKIDLAAQPLKNEIKTEDENSFKNGTVGKWRKIGRQNPQSITPESVKAIGGGINDSPFNATPGSSVVPENISVTPGKGTHKGVSLGDGNSSVQALPVSQRGILRSPINPGGIDNRGGGSAKAVHPDPTTITISDLQSAEGNNKVNQDPAINQDKPTPQNRGDGKTESQVFPVSQGGTTNTVTATPVDSGSGEIPVPVTNNNSAVPQIPEATKGGGGSSTSNPRAGESIAPSVNSQQPITNNGSSGSTEPSVSLNTATPPKTESNNSKAQQGTSNNSSIKPGADLNIGSGDLDSQGNKKPTTLNLSNLQKAERKNK